MAESVRLVIWDLDETFWKGTLTEGGISVVEQNCSLIIELARRGIVSSICSKNDHESVKKILEGLNIWEYFVLPSINWEPKGPRIRDLVETFQLRAPTVMFIDDNPLNLEEAKRFVPELQVSSEHVVADLLDDPRYKGKNDSELTRLKQYRLLELRKRDASSSSGGVEQFLRDSQIRVEIIYDVLSHLDRAVELITRTNQLNFTKEPLAPDAEAAREQLKATLGEYHVHAGLIHVVDRYGDHGYCGLYVTKYYGKKLLHFCFSCRILGMGVEAWIYNKLSRPFLHVSGEVLTDVINDRRLIDWIGPLESSTNAGAAMTNSLSHVGLVWARGGCDLEAMMHYFRPVVAKVVGEYATSRNGFQVRRDHTMFLRYAIEGVDERIRQAYCQLGYQPADLDSTFPFPVAEKAVYLLSFIVDPTVGLYRHKETGVLVPFQAPGVASDIDVRNVNINDLSPEVRTEETAEILRHIEKDFDFVGVVTESLFKENLQMVLDHVPPNVSVVLMLSSEDGFNKKSGTMYDWKQGRDVNRWIRAVATEYPFVSLLDIRSLVEDKAEMDGQFHYDRIVYFRAFKTLEQRFSVLPDTPQLGPVAERSGQLERVLETH